MLFVPRFVTSNSCCGDVRKGAMTTTCSLKKRTIQDVGCGKDTDESCKRVNACLSMLRKTIPLGNDEEGRCFQLGLASEKHGEWRLAWELFFGLVEHLGTLRSTKASDMYAHAAVRCASLASRVQGLVSFCDIPVLCSHLRVCFIEALGERKLCRRLPAPRKLLEWIVHVALPLNTESCSEAATAATECWQQVQQALLQGGDQAVRALMDQRSSEEQTQLLRLLGHHARNVQPGAADVVADIMQRLLQQLVQNDHNEALQETFSKPNDAAVWLKTIATALEGLTLHLSCSSQKTRSLLDWADDFLVQLGAAVTGLRLQPLYALLARGRLRAMEAFRATKSMSRSEVFDVWKEPIFQQLQVLVKQEGRTVKYGEVPAQLQPMFQLAGLLRCQGHVEHVEHVEHWCHRAQSFESLRLQLPPGPISAILALCQLQLHYQIFTSNFQQFKVSSKAAKVAVFSAECSSFGRLVISLATDPEFRAVLGSSGVSLALQALRAQLEHYISGGNEMGRMRFLQVQACALQAQLDGDPEDCKRFMNLALDEWQGVVLERWSDLRTPCSLMKALESAGDQRNAGVSLCVRDVSDAAYIMETLDLHALCMGALALCLACTVQQNGREALSWLQGTDGTEHNTLPRSSREVLVILLYRLAAAAGRLDQDGFGRQSNQVDALEWWKFAEVRKATLGDAPVAPIVTQRMIALTSMPESCFLSQWRSGGCRLEAFNADQGLQDGLMFAEAFWSWSQWSAKWQDIQCGQCPGGSAVGCQTAALRSLKVLFHGPKVYSQGQKEPSQALSPELLRWPAWRSGLLQLRVIHQVSLLYDCLGESDLAIACADCGLELMERKLCGDCRWKIRFLCIRTRCAVSCFSDVTKEEHALHDIEDLWNRRIQGQPRVELTTTCEGVAVEPVEPDGTISSPGMPWELLTLWVNASSKQRRQGRLLRLLSQADEAKLQSESVVLLIQLQMEDRSELWTETVQRLLKKISDHPSKAPFPRALCPALALLAQALFNDLKDGTCPGAEVNWSWSLLKAAADLKQCCMVLSQPAEQLIDSIQVAPSLKSFLQVCAAALRGALFMGESAVARHCAQLLLRVEEVVGAARPPRPPRPPNLEEGTNSRERSPSRESGDIAFSRAQWKLCKQVVPCAFGVSLLFMTELRAMQRRLEKMDHWSALERLGPGSTTSMLGVMAVEDVCSGNWMSQLGSDMSLAWLQVDWKSSSLQISRSADVNPERSERLLSQRLPLQSQVLRGLQDELQQLHRSNSEKIKELWQRQDKKSEAVRLEFWRSRKGFDDQLGKLVEKIQKEVLGVGRFLLAPWPQSAAAKQRVLDSLRSWLTNEAAEMADGLRLNGSLDDPEQAEHVFLLALLLIEAENLEVAELLLLLGQLWDAGRSALRRWAYSMRRHSSDLRGSLKELNEASEVPLLLYLDGVMAQLPLEACPCLRQRNVVRGLAPSITLSSLASKPVAAEATGFFVIDPAEDCAAMGDVRQLLTSWSSHGQSWHGHTGKLPEPSRVLEELCRKDVFVYLGHGERVRQLLRHEKLQVAGEVAEENDSRRAGLRSTLMLLGCSSVKIQKGSMEGDIESFGLASSALLGGAPLVLGAQWDVLGGDLDKLASRLLQRWLKEGKTSCPSRGGLLTALKDLRPKCLLPNLTGASLVCYGIPV